MARTQNAAFADNGVKVRAATRRFRTVMIPGSNYVSGPVELDGETLVAIYLKSDDWTQANVGFLISLDGEDWYLACDALGLPIMITVSAPGRAFSVPVPFLLGALHAKAVSLDANGMPANQADDRELILVTAP